MGAISPDEIEKFVWIGEPSRAARSGGFFVVRSSARLILNFDRREAGTGDPGPGARAETRVPKRAGPAGGNEAMSRTPMAERTLSEFAIGGAPAPQKDNF